MSRGFYNRVGGERIATRQIDELIGLCRGLLADGSIVQAEVEFLQKWLAANAAISDHPLIGTLYDRIDAVLEDGHVDEDERRELFDTLSGLTGKEFELGEELSPTTLPLCNPAPSLIFESQRYCFTGTFNYGIRKDCEAAVMSLGATVGSVTQKTNVLVIGMYATDSWKHSTFGNKILKASEWRAAGHPISIVSESHWVKHLAH